ncbi:hypothetical protein K435DRAFT_877745 [Dendrothele bispora CBS 962.96]|uniref:DUF4219 domain-containing protein n=1 Tax=Dendrothele bispora (strain CBS 962.96) TaxID=1314807 RepID=A0A4S8KPI0_DENBC|nr:hypothetical protein K435DRAFT_877745 [Dendrothele bispora CBS 962.96]
MSSALVNCVPVLTGANWIEWSDAIKAFLMSQGVWYVMEDSPPAATDAAATKTWRDDKYKAMGNILLRVSPQIWSTIQDATGAKERPCSINIVIRVGKAKDPYFNICGVFPSWDIGVNITIWAGPMGPLVPQQHYWARQLPGSDFHDYKALPSQFLSHLQLISLLIHQY